MSNIKPENQTAYYQKHPPKCISGFLSQPEWLDNIDYDGHGFTGIYPDGLIANPNIVLLSNVNAVVVYIVSLPNPNKTKFGIIKIW